ncbi:aldehyde dehydrogenase family protein [Nocardioides fonticola]|uniref:aldehyde dehydrogenase (NAD(+)) n=1 Tax=Nocardioides fonticola TaxID=450363 RepID=A0ABP7XGA5_9ACTN
MAETRHLGRATAHLDGVAVELPGDGVPLVSPWSEQTVGEVPEAADLVDLAVVSARRAHEQLADWTPSQRADLLERWADLIERDTELLAGLVSTQMGMPITLARATQGDLPPRVLRASAEAVRRLAWEEERDGALLLRRGAGVVGAITPWNMPVHQIVAKAAGALGAGCAMVLKPSEQTPFDAVHLAHLLLEAGAPVGTLNVLPGTGPVTGAALVAHPGLARISFTGSVAAGRLVAAAGAATLTPCTLELGGKSPAVVLPDADPATVLPRVLASGLVNSGQACNATTRLLLPADRVEEATALLPSLVAQQVLGDPGEPATTQGPLVTEQHRERVLAHIDDAIAAGGHLLTGTGKPVGGPDHGFFVEPTVITGLGRQARAVQEEIFGPVLVVQTYTDLDDALHLAHDTPYALSAEVWGADADAASRFARRLRTGQVKINGVRTRERPGVPFGGSGASGYGRELGEHGIVEMCEMTAVMA